MTEKLPVTRADPLTVNLVYAVVPLLLVASISNHLFVDESCTLKADTPLATDCDIINEFGHVEPSKRKRFFPRKENYKVIKIVLNLPFVQVLGK